MPLYDCMLLLKPNVRKEALFDLVARVGKHVYKRNGVLTDLKSYGTVQLGYGIRKLDGRYYQGQLLQMTMMTPPSMNSELYYLNKEDRLLRWLLIKHRGTKFMGESEESHLSHLVNEMDAKTVLRDGSMIGELEDNDNDFDDDDDDDDDDDEQPESGEAWPGTFRS